MLLHVGVTEVQVAALGAREGYGRLLLLEVDVALVLDHGPCLIQWLRETGALGEGVGTRSSTHVSVLALKSFGINCDGTSLGVVTSWHTLAQLIISSFGRATIHTSLHNEVIVTITHWHELTILGLHDLAADSVLSKVLRVQVLTIGRIEVTLLGLGLDGFAPLAHLLRHLIFDFSLHTLIFATNTGHTGSRALPSAIFRVVRRHDLLVRLAINALVGVVKHLTLDGILEVVMPLGDVRLRDCSVKS